jgi:hypothetical protein
MSAMAYLKEQPVMSLKPAPASEAAKANLT